MPEYKLIYFNGRGRGEFARWIMEYCGIKYTDERIAMEDWPERKKSIRGGRLPVLMVDDKPLPQSVAIARYLAKIGDLVPEDPLKAAYCDAMVDTLSELMQETAQIMFMSKDDEETKKKKFNEEFIPNTLAPRLTRFNGRLEDSSREWLVGEKITWADLLFAIIVPWIVEKNPSILDQFPAVLAHCNKVSQLPAIKKWIDRRPVTPF